jgi:hypothetical protein
MATMVVSDPTEQPTANASGAPMGPQWFGVCFALIPQPAIAAAPYMEGIGVRKSPGRETGASGGAVRRLTQCMGLRFRFRQ